MSERLREEGRDGTILLVGIVDPVRVELELAVVPIEDRCVREVAIGIRSFVSIYP